MHIVRIGSRLSLFAFQVILRETMSFGAFSIVRCDSMALRWFGDNTELVRMIVDLHCGDLCFGKDLEDSRKNQGKTKTKRRRRKGRTCRAYQGNFPGKRGASLKFQRGLAPTRGNSSGRRRLPKIPAPTRRFCSGRRSAMTFIYKVGLSDFDS